MSLFESSSVILCGCVHMCVYVHVCVCVCVCLALSIPSLESVMWMNII